MIPLVLKNPEPEAAVVRAYAELSDAPLLLINTADEPIEIDGSKLDLGEDLYTTNSPCTQSDERSDHVQLDVEAPSAPDGPIDEPCNIINATDTRSFAGRAKRVRFASLCNISSLGLSTPPHSRDGEGQRNMRELERSDSDESRDGTTPLKRQKISSRVVNTAVTENNEPSSSVISDVDNVDGLENLSDHTASDTDVPTLTMHDSAIGVPKICPQFVDIGQEWEYRRVLGEEVVGGVSYYEVEWCSSLIPKSSVRNIEVLAEYEARKARARACGTNGKRRGRRPALKQDSRAVRGAGVPAGQQQKRPRGRPRKLPSATVW
jgi:hypothetical protein